MTDATFLTYYTSIMAREKKRNGNGGSSKNGNGERTPRFDLHPETKKSVLGIVFFALAALAILSAFDLAGRAGSTLFAVLHSLLGVGFFLVPLTFCIIGIAFFRSLKTNIYFTPLFGGGLFLLSFLGIIDVFSRRTADAAAMAGNYPAGYIGFAVSYPFLYLFGFWASLLIFFVAVLIAVSVAFNVPLFHKKEDEEAEEGDAFREKEDLDGVPGTIEDMERVKSAGFTATAISALKGMAPPDNKEKPADTRTTEERLAKKTGPSSSQTVADFVVETHQAQYQIPPISLLESDSGKPNSGDIAAYSTVIQKTLHNFGIDVEMGEVNVGPTVTQYTLKPAQGIKLSRIVALQNDLSLSLAAHPLRIEAPIPGRSLVGIEIPNKVVSIVRLRNLIDNPAFAESPPLTMCLGRDVSGNPQYADIEKMPHVLIAGATGSGKSICLHSLLTSLLYKNFPQMLKLLIIDPKRIELAAYNGIPHLLAPIITERDKALAALRWAVKEMERRYEALSLFHVRNISSYNAQVAKGKTDGSIMPYIIIVIDELADLMAVSAKEVEGAIVRLAQMSRAVGLHLVVSTQRPSVEVITGLIKANIPCRIAFQVPSLVDSRTILDMSGAEKLVGNGDMLFLSQDLAKPRRIQGGFVSEKEVKRITDFIRETSAQTESAESEGIASELDKKKTTIDLTADLDAYKGDDDDSDDEMFEQAKEVIAQAQKASTSLLQRRLKLGYARAARLMDMLEAEGLIGPSDGAKPREVYITPQEMTAHDEEI